MRYCPLCVVGASILVATAGVLGMGAMIGAGEKPAVVQSVDDGYTIDGGHSFLTFRVKHNNVAYAYGRFNKISGSFNLDKDNPSANAIDITIDATTIDTGITKRDEHLKSQDFFSVKEFPTATFKSTSFKSDGSVLTCTGDLTMHGVTKTITAPIDITGFGEGRGGTRLAGFESKFVIKRSDFGMNYMQGPLGDEVTIIVSCEGVKK
ncbi:MAG: YceI family protein [Phycisphaerae bacterium]|nr:YceI family protein [Phycisphaerae bacterium]